jgi:hypothetical protein
MLDPQAKALLQLMVDRGVPAVNTLPPKEARDFYILRKALTQPDPPVMSHVHDHLPNLGGVQVPVREYRPMGASATEVLPALVYFHGGGWVIGNIDNSAMPVYVRCFQWITAWPPNMFSPPLLMTPWQLFIGWWRKPLHCTLTHNAWPWAATAQGVTWPLPCA